MNIRKLLLLLAVLFLGGVLRVDAARPRLPAAVWRALDAPEVVTLYSVNPDPRVFHWWGSRWFHDYRLIGEIRIQDPKQKRQVLATVKHAAQTYIGDTKCVISPRHGVRVVSGGKVYDFLICFECLKMEVYCDEQCVAGLSIGGSPDDLNAILRAARIRIAPSSRSVRQGGAGKP